MPVQFQGFAEANVAVDRVSKKIGAQAVVGKFPDRSRQVGRPLEDIVDDLWVQPEFGNIAPAIDPAEQIPALDACSGYPDV